MSSAQVPSETALDGDGRTYGGTAGKLGSRHPNRGSLT